MKASRASRREAPRKPGASGRLALRGFPSPFSLRGGRGFEGSPRILEDFQGRGLQGNRRGLRGNRPSGIRGSPLRGTGLRGASGFPSVPPSRGGAFRLPGVSPSKASRFEEPAFGASGLRGFEAVPFKCSRSSRAPVNIRGRGASASSGGASRQSASRAPRQSLREGLPRIGFERWGFERNRPSGLRERPLPRFDGFEEAPRWGALRGASRASSEPWRGLPPSKHSPFRGRGFGGFPLRVPAFEGETSIRGQSSPLRSRSHWEASPMIGPPSGRL